LILVLPQKGIALIAWIKFVDVIEVRFVVKRRLELNDRAVIGIDKARHLRLGKEVLDKDDEYRLRNVFWADARSRASYEYFGDVITFNTAYLTNIYLTAICSVRGSDHG